MSKSIFSKFPWNNFDRLRWQTIISLHWYLSIWIWFEAYDLILLFFLLSLFFILLAKNVQFLIFYTFLWCSVESYCTKSHSCSRIYSLQIFLCGKHNEAPITEFHFINCRSEECPTLSLRYRHNEAPPIQVQVGIANPAQENITL